MFRHICTGLTFAALSCILSACGNDNPLGRQAIQGTVSLNGSPLDHGVIQFNPEGTEVKVSSGAVVDNGRFSIPQDKGLPPGKYKVMIFSPENQPEAIVDAPGDSGTPPKDKIPAEYNVHSNLFVTVEPGGDNNFPIEIQAP